jgi:hypothetical protein
MLDLFITPSLVWLASQLKMDVQTDEQVPFVAGQAEYPLPRSLCWILWVEVNGALLVPTSTYAMNLNTTNVSAGVIDWHAATPGTPVQYAVEGRSLIINPPPSADFIATTPTFAWRWIGTGENLTPATTPELSDMDQQLVRYDAAIGWLSAHPTPENQARIAAYTAEINRRLPAAKQRWENALQSWYPSLSPDTVGRFRNR